MKKWCGTRLLNLAAPIPPEFALRDMQRSSALLFAISRQRAKRRLKYGARTTKSQRAKLRADWRRAYID
jgi:hypothetical protein